MSIICTTIKIIHLLGHAFYFDKVTPMAFFFRLIFIRKFSPILILSSLVFIELIISHVKSFFFINGGSEYFVAMNFILVCWFKLLLSFSLHSIIYNYSDELLLIISTEVPLFLSKIIFTFEHFNQCNFLFSISIEQLKRGSL